MKQFLAMALLFAGFTACRTPHEPLPTASKVDVKRYMGTWYEVARLPAPFQRAGEGAMAEYTLQADGSVRVVNTAIEPDGGKRSVRGRAEPVPGSGNSRFRVKFEGLASLAPVPAEGNYWIIALDERRYRYSMVGTPDRKFLWLLSRTPGLDSATQAMLIRRAQSLGFGTPTRAGLRQEPENPGAR